MIPGKFITVEGIDGAGKSSHIAAIAAFLRERGLGVIETREPGGTPLGEQLRAMILHQTMSPIAELLCVFAARAEHVSSVSAPALAKGDWVVCDRFTDSTLAYQGGGREMDTAVIKQLALLTHAHCCPDLTLIFDIDLDIATARVRGRGVEDKFEAQSQAFIKRVQKAYQTIADENPQRCYLIDGGKTLEAVRNDVLAVLASQMNASLGYQTLAPAAELIHKPTDKSTDQSIHTSSDHEV